MISKNVAMLLAEAGVPSVPVRATGKGPVLPSVYRVDEVAGASVLAATAAAAALWELRGGPRASAEVDLGHAGLAFRSEHVFKIAGSVLQLWADLSGDYPTSDGWVRLHCNFEHHGKAAVRALGCAATKEAVQAACLERTSVEIETAVLAAGGAAGAMRSRDEWTAFAHGPLVGLGKAGEGPVVRPPEADRPLAGIRVLDLTRVIAGPVATRTLAAHGADVLRIGAATVPEVPGLVLDMSFGKRSCHLDLKTATGRETLRELAATADVLVQSYRPGAIAALGLTPDGLRRINPSLVTVDISAYEAESPWAPRRGFDSLVQMTTGIAREAMLAAGADRPVPLPAQALDHATGYLGAFAAIAGLVRRAMEGGSWHANLSLARTARWLDSLGRAEPGIARPTADDVIAAMDSRHGVLTFVLPPGLVSGHRPGWETPPPLDGSALAQWL